MSDVDPEPDFDVIVIGAGIAGSITAYQLAQQGHSVVLIERGETPGSKNLSGGVLYCRPLLEVFPDLLSEAPIERKITRNYIQFLNDESAVGIDYQDQRLADPVNAVTVLRAHFDAWLAEKCEEVGVMVMSGVLVDKVLRDSQGAVCGVVAGEDELRSRVVVAADGINSFISKEAGLRGEEPLNHLALGVKAVITLDRKELEDRFRCTGDEGVAYAIVGDATEGVGGGSFLYTNMESISLGVVLRLDDLVASGKSSDQIFDHFLAHPFIAPLIKGGELVEYGSHLVAEGGLSMMGTIYSDGVVVVGDAAGLTLNTGLTVRGMDLAAGSAIAAAKAIHESLESGDTSASALASYRKYLDESFVGQDMKTYSKAPAFLETDRLYKNYGEMIANILYGAFNHDITPRKHLSKVAWQSVKDAPVSIRQISKDLLSGVRAL